jgi:tetratricopeptide (TPR) repeat protein
VKKSHFFIIPLAVILFSGCGTTLKQQWYDFTAYYNTFYNAKQYFNAGLEENRSQRSDINPNELIRIHPPPTGAGAQNFARSIEKSADLLRNHSRSKYIDEAIQLIGFSFFYRQEYFAALEKFQELYASTIDPDKQQSATIWEGRTYLELQLYGEGSRFMETRIENLDQWEPEKLSEARVILAQLYTYQGNLHQAGNQLLVSLENLEGSELRPRAYYHYGQIMERMENLQQAAYAFREIQNMRPSFDLVYNASLKEADILRKNGDYSEASFRLRSMERDNKFYNYRLEILYEIARTERMMGNPEEAMNNYFRVIQSGTATPEQQLLARIYYGLAEIYRFNYNNFQLAAAYYDSASAVSVNSNLLPDDWDADDLASAFGEYVNVKQNIARLDSLLHLGRLPEDEFEQRIAEIRAERQAELESQQLERERRELAGRMVDYDSEVEVTTDTERYGFLYVNNRTMLEQAALRFRAIWGNRPLVDDWRRSEVISGSRTDFENQRVVIESEDAGQPSGDGVMPGEVHLNLGEIPFERSEQDSVEALIYRYYYQLGNIYLLNLNIPDSAKVYFERVIREGPPASPKAEAYYALAEISIEQNNRDEASEYARELIDNYPDSPLANRAAARLNLPKPVTEEDLLYISEFLSSVSEDTLSDTTGPLEEVHELLDLSENTTNREQAARALLEAAQLYIKAARDDSIYVEKQHTWQRLQDLSSRNPDIEALFRGEPDSIEVEQFEMILLGIDYEEGLQRLTLPVVREMYPYQGEYWQLSRSLLQRVNESYPGTRAARTASLLLEELERYPALNRFSEEE